MNKKTLLTLIAFLAVIALLAGVYLLTRPETTEGEKAFTVTVVHKNDTEKVFHYTTDETYLGPALVALGLIPEGNIQSGMFDTVDGETAVWAEDEGWWALYVGDTQASVGINDMPVSDGDAFRLVYVNGWAE